MKMIETGKSERQKASAEKVSHLCINLNILISYIVPLFDLAFNLLRISYDIFEFYIS